MAGDVVGIGWLLPGASVSVRPESCQVKISRDTTEVFELTDGVSQLEGAPADTGFTEVLAVDSDADHPLALVRVDMKYDENFSPGLLSVIRSGRPYITTLADEQDVELQLFFPLAENDAGALMLGIVVPMDRDSGPKTDESVVAMLDILGFSNLMSDTDLDGLELAFTTTLQSVLTGIRVLTAGTIVLDEDGNLDQSPALAQVGYGVVSDSIILYPLDPGEDRGLRVICEASAHLLDTCLDMQWPLRGGIGVGAFRAVKDHPVFLGLGLLEAHRLELQQEWCAC